MKNGSAISMILVAAIVVILIVAGAVGAYVLMQPSPEESPSSSPTATPTASPSDTSSPSESQSPSPTESSDVFPSPTSPVQAYVNFQDGAYANYSMKYYQDGELTMETPMDWDVSDGTYEGQSVWILRMTSTVEEAGISAETIVSMYMDKTTTEAIHMRMQMFSDGQKIMDEEYDPDSPYFDPGSYQEIDPNTIVGQETITVAAGTFNCDKAQTTVEGTQATIWVSTQVPVFGIVKMESHSAGNMVSAIELLGYGT